MHNSLHHRRKNMCLKDTCVICLEDAEFKRLSPSKALAVQKMRNNAHLPQMGERLKCGHIFHRKCILPWFLNLDSENSYNCPMCRGEIVFSNNLGMTNGSLFNRKYELEYKKAYDEGYYYEDEDDYYEDEEDEDDESGFDDDGDDESGFDDDLEDYATEDDEDYATEDEEDLARQISEPPQNDLRYYLSHEGETDPDEEQRRWLEQEFEPIPLPQNQHCYSMRVSYRCQYRMFQNGIVHLTRPKVQKYAFRPHPCYVAN
jgi:hypothetical protein